MDRKGFLLKIASIFLICFCILVFPIRSIYATELTNQPSPTDTYDIVLTSVSFDEQSYLQKRWEDGGYIGQQLNVEDYFGKEVVGLNGLNFELRKESVTGELIQSGVTSAEGRLVFTGIPAGRYVIILNEEASSLSGIKYKLSVPVEVNLPVFKEDGTWYTTGEDALHVYPKQVIQVDEEKTKFHVKKVWKGKQLENVTVNLKKNGEIVDSIELSNSNNWEYTFENLDKQSSNGETITYSAEEVVPENYTATYVPSSDGNGITITNTYVPTKPPRSMIIKTGTLEIFWIIGISVVMIGFGYRLYRTDNKNDDSL
ncbi:TPA: Cna B-type domain-containing protein [Streptococcus suis]|nr:Cna B-type domain-containing protein [Streptococcus suis]HEM2720371.1 Cna B-type domain-containing protein [Streptococcus suis]HEM5217004.1 Cna B-type domain-containing protein [Streptococcus suis]